MLSLAVLCLAGSSCSEEGIGILEDFTFESITYNVETPEDGKTESVHEILKQRWANGTAVEKTVTVTPDPPICITVTLTSDDPQAFNWEGSEELYLYQPYIYEDGTAGHISNEEYRVPYKQGTNIYDHPYWEKELTYTISPCNWGEMEGKTQFVETQVTYTLTLKGKLTGKTKTVKGKLVYNCPVSLYTTFTTPSTKQEQAETASWYR